MKNNGIVRFFYKGKHCKKTNTDNVFAMLLPSLLGIFICAVCLMGSTWAWFTATQSIETVNIQAASYTVSVKVNDLSLEINNPATLEKGTYTVTLTAGGDATTGYCTITIGDSEKLIFQFPSINYSSRIITFTLVMNEPAKVEFASCWGTSVVDDTNRILQEQAGTYTYGKAEDISPAEEKDETTESPADTTEDSTTEEATATETEPTLDPTQYTVQSGDTLDKIAKLYNTTATVLLAYNNIENASHIEVGDTIKIPPADWKIPETTTEETTLPTTTKSEPPSTEPVSTEPVSTEPVSTEPSETGSETTGDTAETTATQETTGTTQIPSESDSNE